jgi:L-alanine-DL-glutamate epimerase-like enolase superfamily enzyme
MRLELRRHTLRLAGSLHTSYGSVRERTLLAVSLSGRDGVTGHGEAAPLYGYDGVELARVEQALARHREVLARSPGELARGELLERCRHADPLPAALAAIDIALWDREGKLRGRPVAELLCERPAQVVEVNATISASGIPGAAAQAKAARAAGFGCVKLKVGIADDAQRVSAVRDAAGPGMALRVDANGAWTVEQAVRAIGSLQPAGLELVEEPVHGLAQTRQVRERVTAQIAIDETAADPGALTAGAADAVCLKISRCGGISGLLAAAEQVLACGAQPYLASALDGPLGIAAALHAAAAIAARAPLPPCGLATLALFEDVADQLAPRDGAIALPPAAGLGVHPL